MNFLFLKLKYFKILINSSKQLFYRSLLSFPSFSKMNKDAHPFCYFVDNNGLVPAIFHDNKLIEANQDERRSQKSPKVLLYLKKQLTFSILTAEISVNQKQKFSIQIKTHENQVYFIIVQDEEELDIFIKNLSQIGMGINFQEIVASCEKIGEGNFAEVYKIITNYDSTMALKSFHKKNLRIYKNKLAFHNQIDIIRSLNSKYIVTVDGLFETQKNIYMKMEYFPYSLKYYCKRNLSIKTQKRIMSQILQALIELKSKNIIHRDVKPDNIMIRGRNQKQIECVLIDFGLSTLAHADHYIFNRCGTPGFMAPEIAKMTTKGKLTPACDIFSLGCLFYWMLTKKYIFAAENYNQVVTKNKAVDVPWESFNQFSENEKDLLQKMLQKNPFKRITPQQAIKHSYFKHDFDDQDEIPNERCDLKRKMRTFAVGASQSIKHTLKSITTSASSNVQGQKNKRWPKIQEQCAFKDSGPSFDGPDKGSDPQSENEDFSFALEAPNKPSRSDRQRSRFFHVNNTLL